MNIKDWVIRSQGKNFIFKHFQKNRLNGEIHIDNCNFSFDSEKCTLIARGDNEKIEVEDIVKIDAEQYGMYFSLYVRCADNTEYIFTLKT